AELRQALGFGTKGTRPKNAQAALKDLEKQQKMRAKRFQRDSLDRVLTELSTWYRDVLSMQIGAVDIDESTDGLINSSIADQIRAAADATNPSSTIKAMSAIIETRQALDFNVAPLLAFESLMLKLYEG
ncbi:DNA polymerase III subunit delta', partial [Propionimicrobium lymphophilum]|nr:DNA polymerase III subunit delta' [Propionimicrobium lymphophilum]MDK7734703.1 DNA polymerase III subunit delta' [Propionimicrobium lymphophilum]